jgi:hypothetical protein
MHGLDNLKARIRYSVTLRTPADSRLLFGVPVPNKPKHKLDGQPDDGILSALPFAVSCHSTNPTNSASNFAAVQYMS